MLTSILAASSLALSFLFPQSPLLYAELKGTDFRGGANSRYGAAYFDEPAVNYVYAQPTGELSRMEAVFTMTKAVPPAALLLRARDDDDRGKCAIEMSLNGHTLYRGKSSFPDHAWQTRRIAIPAGVLQTGENRLVIRNTEPKGTAGLPPWFMVASCMIADANYRPERDILRDFRVELPKERRPIPEPLVEGAAPGFRIRGTKGWHWTPEQYLAEIPTLARHKMNFLMNCYTSLYSDYAGWKNEWWKPLPEATKRAYAHIAEECRKHEIDFCFALNPQLSSPRPLNPNSDADFEALWQHYAWAQSVGVRWFCVALDDVSGVPIRGGEHAKVVNKLLQRLRQKDPRAMMIFCPTWYWGTAKEPVQRDYLQELGRTLHPDVYVFWTGPQVVSPKITLEDSQAFEAAVGHRIILWDNYPVNDGNPTLHLGPVVGRDGSLPVAISGYMSNPMATQNEINRIPLLTCADYAYNPFAYDPARSIGQAILDQAHNGEQRAVLKELVEAYPGSLVYGSGSTGFNPVRQQFARIAGSPHAKFAAVAFFEHFAALMGRFDKAFKGSYPATRKTVTQDLAWIKAQIAEKYSP